MRVCNIRTEGEPLSRKWVLLVVLLAILTAGSAAQGPVPEPTERTWKKVQYLGGAVGVRGTSMTWNNTLTVSPKVIGLRSKEGVIFQIDPERITALAYFGRRYGKDIPTWHVLRGAVFGAPRVVALWHEKTTTEHLIAIEYLLPDGRESGVLLRAHKSNYEAIIGAMGSVIK